MTPHVLGIFAKEPRPGQVKTRLASSTSPEWAAQFADAMIRDTVACLARVKARRFLVYSPHQGRHYFAALAGNDYDLIPQEHGDLGRRMERFMADQLRAGAERVVVVGTDSPTMPIERIEQAFQKLAQVNVVIGPATDGGYYLLGCTNPLPPIFDNIRWGSDSVFRETIEKLTSPSHRASEHRSWSVEILPSLFDVDTLADVWVLKAQLAELRCSGVDPELPHSEDLLATAEMFRPESS